MIRATKTGGQSYACLHRHFTTQLLHYLLLSCSLKKSRNYKIVGGENRMLEYKTMNSIDNLQPVNLSVHARGHDNVNVLFSNTANSMAMISGLIVTDCTEISSAK